MNDHTLHALDAAPSPLAAGDVVRSPALSGLPGIRHAFFTRRGGVSEGVYATLNGGQGSNDDAEAVRENRGRMAATLGVAPGALVSVHQVHSADALVVDAPFPGPRPRADGLATRTPALAVSALSADCGPLLFADAEARVVGAAHAGWRGARAGILEATIAAMETLGARRGRIVVALGPTIGPESYEVGPDFIAAFEAGAGGADARFFRPSPRLDHALFDLPAYLGARAEAARVGHFENLALDTVADEDRFFSYRRNTLRGIADYGRLVSAVALEG